MNPKTLRKCIRKAKAFARQYSFHPKFRQYTEDEIAIGGALALALVKEYHNYEYTGRLPVPDRSLVRLRADIGLDGLEDAEFHRVMDMCFILLDLLKVKTEDGQHRAESLSRKIWTKLKGAFSRLRNKEVAENTTP